MEVHEILRLKMALEKELQAWPKEERHGHDYYNKRQEYILLKAMLRRRGIKAL